MEKIRVPPWGGPWPKLGKNIDLITDVYLKGLASYLFYQYYCLRVNRVYAEINTFLPPFSKRLFIAMIHRKVFNVKTVNIQYMWRKFLRNIRE